MKNVQKLIFVRTKNKIKSSKKCKSQHKLCINMAMANQNL